MAVRFVGLARLGWLVQVCLLVARDLLLLECYSMASLVTNGHHALLMVLTNCTITLVGGVCNFVFSARHT